MQTKPKRAIDQSQNFQDNINNSNSTIERRNAPGKKQSTTANKRNRATIQRNRYRVAGCRIARAARARRRQTAALVAVGLPVVAISIDRRWLSSRWSTMCCPVLSNAIGREIK